MKSKLARYKRKIIKNYNSLMFNEISPILEKSILDKVARPFLQKLLSD